MNDIAWDIRREGRGRGPDEWWDRYQLAPKKIEAVHGKILNDDEERLTMLGLLLENLGVDRVIRLGTPQVWREAIADLPDEA